jgi:hypothetical protein
MSLQTAAALSGSEATRQCHCEPGALCRVKQSVNVIANPALFAG